MDPTTAQLQQAQLIAAWKQALAAAPGALSLEDAYFRVHSQNAEDGLLLYVFTAVGTTNKQVVEICAGDGQTCNSANLIVNHGWDGYLFDGDESNVLAARDFYGSCHDTRFWPPKIQHAWITRDNVNDLLRGYNLAGDVDLLSMDIDGNDYWILEAIDVISPRVIIAEYQQAWGPDIAVTQRYEEDFTEEGHRAAAGGPVYVGASLKALTLLARSKGYRLIGRERKCFNAIFMRDDVGADVFPSIEPAACFDHVMARYNIAWMPERIDPADSFWVYL